MSVQSSELIDLEADIVKRTESLQTLLRKYATSATIYQLPKKLRDEDDYWMQEESSGFMPYTTVTKETDLLETAINSYKLFYSDGDSSTRFVYRLPGFIMYEGPNDKLYEQLTLVNQAKKNFSSAVKNFRNHQTKWEVVHAALPYLIESQLVRKIIHFDQPLMSIGFSWAAKPSTKKFSQEELIDKISKSLKQNHMKETPTWIMNREKELESLTKLNSASRFIYKRSLKPRPVCNLRTVESKPFQRDGYLPIILTNQECRPEVNDLKDYDPDKKKKAQRQNNQKTKLFSEYFKIYEVIE